MGFLDSLTVAAMSSVGFFHDVTSCLPEILFYCSFFKFNKNTHIAYEPLLYPVLYSFTLFFSALSNLYILY